MAPSPRLISFLFLLAILSVQIHARESQFFSKVSGATTTTPSTTTISNDNAQDKTLPSKEKEEELSKQEQDPAFIPDNQNGYGLYGQESTQFPTTTKLANAPYTTTTYQPYKTQNQNQESYTNYPTDTTTNTNTNTNTNYYSNNATTTTTRTPSTSTTITPCKSTTTRMISKRARKSSMCHDCNLCGQAIKRVSVFQLYWVLVLDNVGLCLVGKIKLHKFHCRLCVFTCDLVLLLSIVFHPSKI
ncbi:hypothetical protein NC653_027333 [Populus alba x Populus x berolinensis]|uniref:Uncharacterized protein n=1 Tax=Populus alba x Populus x berolinensis TaxID=444605 RepID=A0AAD6Q515_9ROSI|nr:hypothetical protein NC653_027333 [Populus alba x Populus x berolinensis]